MIATAAMLLALAQAGAPDPEFQKYPFDQWLAERAQPAVRWSANVDAPRLSFHQRLVATIDVKVDGRDIQNRPREGDLEYLVQISDASGAKFQNHGAIDLAKLDEDVKRIDLQYAPEAFLLPGDYQLAVVIVFTKTGEHSARQSRFRIAPPKVEMLREAWRDLPTVEFLGNAEPPDAWYLPDVAGRLEWASAVRSPARLSIILNVVPAPPRAASRQGESVANAALIPTLRSLSETGSSAISERIQVLDISRHKSVFHQDSGELRWPPLKSALGQASTASIDIASLSERHRDAQFFVQQVRNMLASSDQSPCALVVLTPPVSFESGEDLEPISLEGLPACHVFYVRYRAPGRLRPAGGPAFGPMMRRGPRGPMPPMRAPQPTLDQLEQTLKPLAPKVFDIETADQMTRVFIEIEKALAGR